MHFRSLDPNDNEVSQTLMSQPCTRTMLSQVFRLLQGRAILSRRHHSAGYHRSLQWVHLSRRLFRVRQKGLSGVTLCPTFNQTGQRSMLSSVYQAPSLALHHTLHLTRNNTASADTFKALAAQDHCTHGDNAWQAVSASSDCCDKYPYTYIAQIRHIRANTPCMLS